ncbi:hypothetical protein IE53DRAFT_386592 [Violaceomyces palustris]|uniref:Uncharacterized protein n=1 Tax=Violaceomyces palustris TaxID=1673888 RepID=A0ACD0NZF0_9BASI|nr:hypothetical protein IE53DRAFT_386592 [Violaceomyces palustris]
MRPSSKPRRQEIVDSPFSHDHHQHHPTQLQLLQQQPSARPFRSPSNKATSSPSPLPTTSTSFSRVSARSIASLISSTLAPSDPSLVHYDDYESDGAVSIPGSFTRSAAPIGFSVENESESEQDESHHHPLDDSIVSAQSSDSNLPPTDQGSNPLLTLATSQNWLQEPEWDIETESDTEHEIQNLMGSQPPCNCSADAQSLGLDLEGLSVWPVTRVTEGGSPTTLGEREHGLVLDSSPRSDEGEAGIAPFTFSQLSPGQHSRATVEGRRQQQSSSLPSQQAPAPLLPPLVVPKHVNSVSESWDDDFLFQNDDEDREPEPRRKSKGSDGTSSGGHSGIRAGKRRQADDSPDFDAEEEEENWDAAFCDSSNLGHAALSTSSSAQTVMPSAHGTPANARNVTTHWHPDRGGSRLSALTSLNQTRSRLNSFALDVEHHNHHAHIRSGPGHTRTASRSSQNSNMTDISLRLAAQSDVSSWRSRSSTEHSDHAAATEIIQANEGGGQRDHAAGVEENLDLRDDSDEESDSGRNEMQAMESDEETETEGPLGSSAPERKAGRKRISRSYIAPFLLPGLGKRKENGGSTKAKQREAECKHSKPGFVSAPLDSADTVDNVVGGGPPQTPSSSYRRRKKDAQSGKMSLATSKIPTSPPKSKRDAFKAASKPGALGHSFMSSYRHDASASASSLASQSSVHSFTSSHAGSPGKLSRLYNSRLLRAVSPRKTEEDVSSPERSPHASPRPQLARLGQGHSTAFTDLVPGGSASLNEAAGKEAPNTANTPKARKAEKVGNHKRGPASLSMSFGLPQHPWLGGGGAEAKGNTSSSTSESIPSQNVEDQSSATPTKRKLASLPRKPSGTDSIHAAFSFSGAADQLKQTHASATPSSTSIGLVESVLSYETSKGGPESQRDEARELGPWSRDLTVRASSSRNQRTTSDSSRLSSASYLHASSLSNQSSSTEMKGQSSRSVSNSTVTSASSYSTFSRRNAKDPSWSESDTNYDTSVASVSPPKDSLWSRRSSAFVAEDPSSTYSVATVRSSSRSSDANRLPLRPSSSTSPSLRISSIPSLDPIGGSSSGAVLASTSSPLLSPSSSSPWNVRAEALPSPPPLETIEDEHKPEMPAEEARLSAKPDSNQTTPQRTRTLLTTGTLDEARKRKLPVAPPLALSNKSAPRRNSLSDLRIPSRISRAQTGIRADISFVRDFAKGVEELKALRLQYSTIMQGIEDPSSYQGPPGERKRPQGVQGRLSRVEARYATWWECADVIIGLGEGRSEADEKAQLETLTHSPATLFIPEDQGSPRESPHESKRAESGRSSSAAPSKTSSLASTLSRPGSRPGSSPKTVKRSEFGSHRASSSTSNRHVNAKREMDIIAAMLGTSPPGPDSPSPLATTVAGAYLPTEAIESSRLPTSTQMKQGQLSDAKISTTSLTFAPTSPPKRDRVKRRSQVVTGGGKGSTNPYNTAPSSSSRPSLGAISTDSIGTSAASSKSGKGRLRSASRAGLQGLRELLKVFRSASPHGDEPMEDANSGQGLNVTRRSSSRRSISAEASRGGRGGGSGGGGGDHLSSASQSQVDLAAESRRFSGAIAEEESETQAKGDKPARHHPLYRARSQGGNDSRPSTASSSQHRFSPERRRSSKHFRRRSEEPPPLPSPNLAATFAFEGGGGGGGSGQEADSSFNKSFGSGLAADSSVDSEWSHSGFDSPGVRASTDHLPPDGNLSSAESGGNARKRLISFGKGWVMTRPKSSLAANVKAQVQAAAEAVRRTDVTNEEGSGTFHQNPQPHQALWSSGLEALAFRKRASISTSVVVGGGGGQTSRPPPTMATSDAETESAFAEARREKDHLNRRWSVQQKLPTNADSSRGGGVGVGGGTRTGLEKYGIPPSKDSKKKKMMMTRSFSETSPSPSTSCMDIRGGGGGEERWDQVRRREEEEEQRGQGDGKREEDPKGTEFGSRSDPKTEKEERTCSTTTNKMDYDTFVKGLPVSVRRGAETERDGDGDVGKKVGRVPGLDLDLDSNPNYRKLVLNNQALPSLLVYLHATRKNCEESLVEARKALAEGDEAVGVIAKVGEKLGGLDLISIPVPFEVGPNPSHFPM